MSDAVRRTILEWMIFTRVFDERLESLWKQGRGVGGTFNQRGHEAISVGAGMALGPDDVVAPLHRDVGCYLVRGMDPRRIMANQLGRETGVTGGRDANLHGCGDLSLNIIGFVSHLPQSLPVAVGAAMSFTYRSESRVAMNFVGDGSTNTGLFHESLNLAAVQRAPVVVVVENNQYAYSTPLAQQMAVEDLTARGAAHGVPAVAIDGNDADVVYETVGAFVEKARQGDGPALIVANTMRMRGHAIHDGYEYVPPELLEQWEQRDPVDRYARRLIEEGILEQAAVDAIRADAEATVADAVAYAESSAFPDPATLTDGVYADE